MIKISNGGFYKEYKRQKFKDLEIIKKQNEGGFPLKKSVLIFIVIAWNLLFLSDIILFFKKVKPKVHQLELE